MRKMNIVFGFLILGLWIFSSTAQAGNLRQEGADFLNSVAEKAYLGGDFQDAAHEYSKALLLNPDNPRALKGLNQMGISQGLYKPSTTKFLQQQASENVLDHIEQDPKVVQALTQDKIGNVSPKILEELQKLQTEIKESRKQVDNLTALKQIESAEKTIDQGDMAVAEEVLKFQKMERELELAQMRNDQVAIKEATQDSLGNLNAEAAQQIAQLSREIVPLAVVSETSDETNVSTKPEVVLADDEVVLSRPDPQRENVPLELASQISDETNVSTEPEVALSDDEVVLNQPDPQREVILQVNTEIEEAQIKKAIEDALVYERNLKAMFQENEKIRAKALVKEQQNRQMLSVLEDYLYLHRPLLRDKLYDIEQEMKLAKAHLRLIDRTNELRNLYGELDYYRVENNQKDDVIDNKITEAEQLERKIMTSSVEDMRFFWTKIEQSQQKVFEAREDIRSLKN